MLGWSPSPYPAGWRGGGLDESHHAPTDRGLALLALRPLSVAFIRRDLTALEDKLSKRSFEELPETEREILAAALPSGSLHALEAQQLLHPLISAGNRTFGDENDPQSLARYWAALQRLQELGLVEHAGGALYRLTASGFSSAVLLSGANDPG